MGTLNSGTMLILPSQELEHLRRSWVAFVLVGIALVALGSFAIGWACLTTITIAATWLFGVLLLAGAIAEIFHAFSVSRWSGTLLHVLLGVAYGVAGFVLIDSPGEGAIVLTRLIAFFLLISGVFRVVAGLVQRFPGWGYVVLNGIVTFALGALIYAEWPGSGLWFIGLYLGIEMILNGWSSIALGLTLKNLPAAQA